MFSLAASNAHVNALSDIQKSSVVCIALPQDFAPFGSVTDDLDCKKQGTQTGTDAGHQRKPYRLPANPQGRPGYFDTVQECLARKSHRIAAHTAATVGVMQDMVDEEHVNADIEPTMTGEDFSYMMLQKPGCYVFIGNGEGTHRDSGYAFGQCNLHNPSYDFNDDLLPIGATY